MRKVYEFSLDRNEQAEILKRFRKQRMPNYQIRKELKRRDELKKIAKISVEGIVKGNLTSLYKFVLDKDEKIREDN